MSGRLLDRLAGRRVLVVGDLMLDEYLWGDVTRVSPEAPVPVVRVRRRSATPGGAANVAANVAALGGVPVLVGLVGADAAGDRVRELSRATGVDVSGVAVVADRPTTTKTRILAHGQQVARLDDETTDPVPADAEGQLISAAAGLLPTVRACVLSDYGKGVVSPRLAAAVVGAARAAGVPLVADPKGADVAKFRGAAVVKPNQSEAALAVGRPLPSDADVDAAGAELIARLGGGTAILITRGAAGMRLYRPGRDGLHLPARARDVYDVTGAGDTVAAAIALALAAAAGLPSACRLATRVAGVVVGKVGTATCTPAELRGRPGRRRG